MTSEEKLQYWTKRAKAGQLPLEAAHIITDWKLDREDLLDEIGVLSTALYEEKEGVPHHG